MLLAHDAALREVEGLVFQMASSVTQLKRLVDGLGTQKDTVDFRWVWAFAGVT